MPERERPGPSVPRQARIFRSLDLIGRNGYLNLGLVEESGRENLRSEDKQVTSPTYRQQGYSSLKNHIEYIFKLQLALSSVMAEQAADSRSSIDALLTEHFRYTPLVRSTISTRVKLSIESVDSP